MTISISSIAVPPDNGDSVPHKPLENAEKRIMLLSSSTYAIAGQALGKSAKPFLSPTSLDELSRRISLDE